MMRFLGIVVALAFASLLFGPQAKAGPIQGCANGVCLKQPQAAMPQAATCVNGTCYSAQASFYTTAPPQLSYTYTQTHTQTYTSTNYRQKWKLGARLRGHCN